MSYAGRYGFEEKGLKMTRGPAPISISALVALLCCLASCASLDGRTSQILSVGQDGTGDYSSIQAALDAAEEGAVIHIGPGNFVEHVVISKPVTLQGSGWNKTTILERNRAAEEQNALRDRMQKATTDAERDAIRAEFRKRAAENWLRSPLVVADTKDVIVRGLKVAWPGPHKEGSLSNGGAVTIRHAQATLSNCAVVGSAASGVEIQDESDALIRHCLIAAAWNSGIVVGDREGGGPVKVRIENCDIRNCYYAGIVIRPRCDESVVQDCRVSGAAWHGIRYDDTSPTIRYNAIFANARSGIYASGRTAAHVQGNLFYNNEMDGMSCWFQNRDTIEGNTFVQNHREALAVLGASRPLIRHNVFYDHPHALITGEISSERSDARWTGSLELDRNLFWKNAVVLGHFSRTTQGGPWRIEMRELPAVSNSILKDPLFRNVSRQDFSFPKRSPAGTNGIGVAQPLTMTSPYDLQPEEQAIIPPGNTRDYRRWIQNPGQRL